MHARVHTGASARVRDGVTCRRKAAPPYTGVPRASCMGLLVVSTDARSHHQT